MHIAQNRRHLEGVLSSNPGVIDEALFLARTDDSWFELHHRLRSWRLVFPKAIAALDGLTPGNTFRETARSLYRMRDLAKDVGAGPLARLCDEMLVRCDPNSHSGGWDYAEVDALRAEAARVLSVLDALADGS